MARAAPARSIRARLTHSWVQPRFRPGPLEIAWATLGAPSPFFVFSFFLTITSAGKALPRFDGRALL
jgi:hypothetical protein